MTNAPIQVDDSAIKAKHSENREASSRYNRSYKSKNHKSTPPQDISIGDIVLLREHTNKNKPRDSFIVEDTLTEGHQSYFLLRKISHTMRQRLYKALPEEIIALPGQHLESNRADKQSNKDNPKQDENSNAAEQKICKRQCDLDSSNSKHNKMQATDDSTIKLPRQAAVRANEKIRQSIRTIQLPRSKSKHGWNYEDQPQEEDIYITYLETTYEETEVSSTTSSTSNGESSPEVPENVVSSDEDPQLLWDTSPDQYTLTFTNSAYGFPLSSTPYTHPMHVPPFIPARRRAYATSGPSIKRSQAFKTSQQDHAFISASNNLTGQVIPQEDEPDNNINTVRSHLSRIPKPISPTQVQLDKVNDVSALQYPVPDSAAHSTSRTPLRRSSRITARPSSYRLTDVRDSTRRGETRKRKEEQRMETDKEEQVPREH